MAELLIAAYVALNISGLDSPSWAERERATRALASAGALAVGQLKAAMDKPASVEQYLRCRRLWLPYWERQVDLELDRLCGREEDYGKLPWLHDPDGPPIWYVAKDANGEDYWGRRWTITPDQDLDYLYAQEDIGRLQTRGSPWNLATRVWARRQLRDGRSPDWVANCLTRMRHFERDYLLTQPPADR